jgi:hypothetical protein
MGLLIRKNMMSSIGVEIPVTYLKINAMVIANDKEGNLVLQLAVLTYAGEDRKNEPYTVRGSNGITRIPITIGELESNNIYAIGYKVLKDVLNTELGEEVVEDK